ncbi:hypothetical protein PUN28_008666 [Cardiocondyla obscurior]|uniref:Uncharacterized protein n=1 Tax=Cardiocondyla obscurior TaxID=286306 RepID=A0AAW2G209_9HYME
MEATVDEHKSNLNDELNPKTVHKRRSLVFQTRVSHVCDKDINKVSTGERNLTLDKNQEKHNAKNKVEAFNLKEYIEKLEQERDNWQQEYRNRRAQRKRLAKQKADLKRQEQVFDINLLSEAEKTFILTRPNYEHMYKNSLKLQDVELKISFLNRHIHKLNQKFMKIMENNIKETTIDIIKRSKT